MAEITAPTADALGRSRTQLEELSAQGLRVLAVAQTAAVNMLALGQLAYLLNCRFVTSSSLRLQVFRGDPWVWRMAGAMISLQFVFTYAPFMPTWLHSAPITLRGLSVAIAIDRYLSSAVSW